MPKEIPCELRSGVFGRMLVWCEVEGMKAQQREHKRLRPNKRVKGIRLNCAVYLAAIVCMGLARGDAVLYVRRNGLTACFGQKRGHSQKLLDDDTVACCITQVLVRSLRSHSRIAASGASHVVVLSI